MEKLHSNPIPTFSPSLSPLFQFTSHIPSQYLDGFHSDTSIKFKTTIPSPSFQLVQNILTTLSVPKYSKKNKNWKQNQLLVLAYLIDKACLKTGSQVYSLEHTVWSQISNVIPGKSVQACQSKGLSLFPVPITQLPWTEQEDENLFILIQNKGCQKWKDIALKLFQTNSAKIFRTGKQCRERYLCFLKPDRKKGLWNKQEDYKLVCLFLEYGRKWSKMTYEIDGRNENAIKNRFSLLFEQDRMKHQCYSELKRKVNKKKLWLQKMLGLQKQKKSIRVSQSGEELEKQEKEGDIENISDYQKFFTF